MTAEIAVLNKDAVALAADSTVTISGKKTYHNTNKLFALSSSHPVGIMIYGSGELAGIPWEVLIKFYRKKLKEKSFPHLLQYKSDFIEFLEKDISEYNESEEEEFILEYAENYLEKLVDSLDTDIEETITEDGAISKKEIAKKLKEKIEQDTGKWASKPYLSFANSNIEDSLRSKFSQKINTLIDEKLENHKITKANRLKLLKTCIKIFCSEHIESSGIVFAGFGENDLFPRIVDCGIECIALQKIKYREHYTSVKNNPTNSAFIIPFAQTETVSTFIEGISGKIKKDLFSAINSSLDQFETLITESINEPVKEEVKKALEAIKNKRSDLVSEIFEKLRRSEYKNHVLPIIEAVEFLPKSEMAEVAEALVSITSFRHKISLEQESVGGAIDVAVISKSDGFVWIKRKHYFSSELNPMFMKRYLPTGGKDNG